MTYRKYFDSDDPNGPDQFYDAIAGQASSRTMGRDEKGAFVAEVTGEMTLTEIRRALFDLEIAYQSADEYSKPLIDRGIHALRHYAMEAARRG